MSKFKVGDRVRVIANAYGDDNFINIGHEDVIHTIVSNGIDTVYSLVNTNTNVLGRQIVLLPKDKLVTKLVKKETIGYRCSTIDKVLFESENAKGLLTIDNLESNIVLDLTPHTIVMLYEFFRYLKTDLDEE